MGSEPKNASIESVSTGECLEKQGHLFEMLSFAADCVGELGLRSEAEKLRELG